MANNPRQIELQIKAFNKAFARADKAGRISNEAYELITDLIDYDRMTKSGYAKAGTKYLESMSPKELLAYSSDIQEAKDVLELETMEYKLDVKGIIDGAKDPVSLLWKYQDYLKTKGMPFDSDLIKMVADGLSKKVTWKDLIHQMQKYLVDENYGLSDAIQWFNEKEGLQ